MEAGTVESLRRGLALLAAFDPLDPELSLADLARRTGLPIPTAYRLLSTLVACGFVERHPRSRLYRLGIASVRLGYMGLDALTPRDAAFPFLLDLHRRSSETVSMGVLIGTAVVFVERFPAPDRVAATYLVGSSIPAHCSAIGKVLLADSDPAIIQALFDGYRFEPRASRTVTSLPAFLAQVRRAARDGIAFSDEETTDGTRTVAAPVRNGSGAVVAGIAVTGATYRVSRETLGSRLAALCKATADDVSAVLGYRRPGRLAQHRASAAPSVKVDGYERRTARPVLRSEKERSP